MARLKYIPKSATSTARWESMTQDTKRKKKQPWCVFYTPLGRMVSKPAGRKPNYMSDEEWCAAKTPFKNQTIKKGRR